MYGAVKVPNNVPLHNLEGISIHREKSTNSIKLGALILFAISLVFLRSRDTVKTWRFQYLTATSSNRNGIDDTLRKSYLDIGVRNGINGSHYPFTFADTDAIAEPQKDTEIYIDTGSIDGAITECEWAVNFVKGGGVWDAIPGVLLAKTFSPFGTTRRTRAEPSNIRIFYVTFPSPGDYEVNATCLGETIEGHTDIVKYNAQLTVKCVYVRRELRKMSVADRDAFLDAFIVLSQIPTHEGIQKYGVFYRSLIEFEMMHLKAAGNRRLDHIHDGMGIITQHVSMTNEFELALQTVNPVVAIPYWDYTIDATKVYLQGINGTKNDISLIFKDSILFREDFFGETDLRSHRVTAGRFANLTLPRDYNFSVRSPYGYLRAPWNLNPNKYVTRYHSFCGVSPIRGKDSATTDYEWPSCAVHFRVTNAEWFSSWYDFVWDIGYMPHGPVHSWIGGVGGECDTWSHLSIEGYINATQVDSLKKNSFMILKNAYRNFVVNPPSFCAADATQSECRLKCVDPNGTTARSMFDNSVPWWNSLDMKSQAKVSEKVFCDTAFWPGDHLEAASPVEASFWPIHPTLERLLQYKDLAVPFTSLFWTNKTSEVCLYSMSECEGHHPGDLTFWKTVVLEQSGAYGSHHLTNSEVRRAILPRTGDYAVPYIYDSFEWEHCREIGLHFKAI